MTTTELAEGRDGELGIKGASWVGRERGGKGTFCENELQRLTLLNQTHRLRERETHRPSDREKTGGTQVVDETIKKIGTKRRTTGEYKGGGSDSAMTGKEWEEEKKKEREGRCESAQTAYILLNAKD